MPSKISGSAYTRLALYEESGSFTLTFRAEGYTFANHGSFTLTFRVEGYTFGNYGSFTLIFRAEGYTFGISCQITSKKAEHFTQPRHTISAMYKLTPKKMKDLFFIFFS